MGYSASNKMQKLNRCKNTLTWSIYYVASEETRRQFLQQQKETYRRRSTFGLYGNNFFWCRFTTEFFSESKHSIASSNGSLLIPRCLLPHLCSLLLPFWSDRGASLPSCCAEDRLFWKSRPSTRIFLFLRCAWFITSSPNENSAKKSHESLTVRKHLKIVKKEKKETSTGAAH